MRFAAQFEGHAVILDIAADRYLLTTGPDAAAARPESADLPFRAWTGAALAPPSAALWPEAAADPVAAWRALGCLRRVATLLETRAFSDLVEAVGTAPLGRRGRLPPARVIASFELTRPFFPRQRICRLDAPALCLLMRRYGHPARLVFGARLEPFAAHCWADLHGRVLNESEFNVRTYAPIVAV